MGTIQDFITNRHKYKVDLTYQRPSGAWSNEDKQCLVDTILKSEPMPLFFLNHNSKLGIYYIVDGQQRLHAIESFYDNKLKLNKKFSGEENHGKNFNGDNPISDEQRDTFLNYHLKFHILEDYDDEKVRLIFSRLQRGKPLTLGERLNAKAGKIVVTMREISKHPFMTTSIGISQKRYGNFPDSARILFYEKHGCKDSGTPAIISFFDENQTLSIESKEYKRAVTVLDFLKRCFSEENNAFLSKHAWVFSVYTMVRELMRDYSLKDNEKLIKNFIIDFHNKVYREDFRKSNQKYQRFYDNVRGGWSEKIIVLRKTILIDEFLNKNKISETDEKRQISEEEKISCFAKNPNCESCGKTFKDYKEPQYHHKLMHSEGGKSEIENIMVLCEDCHVKIHGPEEVKLDSTKPKGKAQLKAWTTRRENERKRLNDIGS